ncbi:DNA topoisomerase 3-alpha [Camellia lanceoleosa]|uniref:DNA topoisomerase 3-alpha n=1 Tax=Camellia lanceoleosa TaxID=1840588 RepID=A0ACC0IT07_9ERIC|nr:DNA topoisomerase 3-alpha [Camellia lanceoleosa]
MSGGGGGRTIRVLNVAEKPSVAKAVAGILSKSSQGGMRVRDGRSRFNRIFEFAYTIHGQQCHMLFTSVTGHLMELDFEDRYRKWHSCDPLLLYQAPVRKFVPEDKLDIKRTLEEEARKCQWLVLWLDCDREGENIAFEVVEVCTEANRHLNVWRARFSALIERDIRESVQALVRPNQLFADAVDVRQEIDLRIGASFTRFQTMLLRDAFNLDFATDDRNVILSYGPCQFPTLGFIVERYWEIQAHESEEFWTINCTHNSDEGTATFNWMRGHMFDYTCAVIIYEMCVQEPTATVTKVRQQEKLKYPPHPLNTIELEKRASRYFRMSSEQTMKVAEDLYQTGFISYPRTETDSFSERTDLRAIVQEQEGHPVWGSYAQRLLDPGEGLWRNPGNGGHDDKAHPPIHPTKFSGGQSGWSQDHHRLYELVVRHFLACVSKPAVGAETTVEIDIAGEMFSASGRVILEKNYLDVYRFESWGGSMIPTYTFGQQFIPTTLTLDSGVTRPPSLLSEADLLNCMDKAGIGTDATMHDHIKKLLDRFYATKDSNTRFSPTNLGEALVMGYDDMGYELWKPYLRAMMENDMKAVSIGTKRKAEVLSTCLEQMKACFLDARLNKVKLFEAMGIFFERTSRSGADEQHAVGDVVRRCGVCQESDMVLKRKPDGNFMVGCLGYPQCRNVVWLPGSIAEATVTTNVCSVCSPGPVFMIQFKFRQLEIPPNYNVDHLGCIGGCDEILKQLVEICGTGSRNLSTTPARGRGTATSSSSAQRSNSRQIACTHCRQYGHSSNDCPSQTSRSSRARSQGMNQQSDNAGESSIPCDTCGTPCILRTANTESNRGRKFYSCQSQGCNFFAWEDSLNNSNRGRSVPRANVSSSASNTRARGGRGRGGRSGRAVDMTFVSATGDPISGRRCFVCGDPSHFANVCPNRDT